jgi:prepilin-type N-terminal cleavage/methylation domain-containing protein
MKNRFFLKKMAGRSGFTLIEVVIAMGVTSILMGAITATIYQMWMNNTRDTAHVMAVKQVENSLHFMLRDVQMAQVVETTGLATDEILRLSWITWDDSLTQVTYSWNSTDKKLTRVASTDNGSSTIAYAIATQPVITLDENDLTIDLTSSIRGSSERRVVVIKPRTGS